MAGRSDEGHSYNAIWVPDVTTEEGKRERVYKTKRGCSGSYYHAELPGGLLKAVAPGWAYCPCRGCGYAVRTTGLWPIA